MRSWSERSEVQPRSPCPQPWLILLSPSQGYNPLHLACFGGHITVVGLLLSRSSELLQSVDNNGKAGLHIAAMNGHYQMVEVLLGQGAEINATDKVRASFSRLDASIIQ